MTSTKKFERLSKNVIPINYDLSFKPDLEKYVFDGSEEILLQVKEPTKTITLNCLDIEIRHSQYSSSEQNIKEKIEVQYNVEDEIAVFIFPEEIKSGEGKLILKFKGELNEKLKGFYRSKYTDQSGKEKFAAVTQFEPTFARRAFPCLDDPVLKATFNISLTAPKNLVALSNMPVKSQIDYPEDASLHTTSFTQTPLMSTYLVAMVVGEYDFVEGTDADGVVIRVYTPKGKQAQGSFALDVSIKTLPFYKSYFQVGYPLPKMDLIAISDFALGGMENWGLIMYRETALLVDQNNSSSRTKQNVSLIVGHEIAHMWFGNLVTMEWWSGLWLKEGFASWIAYLCVDHCFPEYDIWTQFTVLDLCDALDLDGLKNSHPVEVEVGNPSEINEIFDAISYSKGASLIHMLYNYLGDEDFKEGLSIYLQKHKYSNSTTQHLWDAFEEATSKPISKMMKLWTQQTGYPVISVTESFTAGKYTLMFSQQRFLSDGSKDEAETEWIVPIKVKFFEKATQPTECKFLLNMKQNKLVLEYKDLEQVVNMNSGAVGFYRMNYSERLLSRLLDHVSHMTASERLVILNDVFALARAGLARTKDALKAARLFVNEKDFTVWRSLNSNLSTILILLQATPAIGPFQQFLCRLFTPAFEAIGWKAKENEEPLVTMLRGLMVARLGKCGDKGVVDEARRRFYEHFEAVSSSVSSKLNGDLRTAVYSVVMRHGDEEDLDKMIKLYKLADSQEEARNILSSLGSVQSEALIKKVLDFCIGPDVRYQDTIAGLVGTTGSALGREMVWKFVKEKWPLLYDRFKGGFLLTRLVKSTTENFTSATEAQDINDFFTKNPVAIAANSIQQSLENISLNEKQLQRDLTDLQEFLSA